jgi:hypothetical protein
MPGELTALLLKALRALSPEERDRVMAELLDARLQPAQAVAPLPAPPPSVLPHALPGAGEHVAALRESLALEAAGPWQTVPVRLPVELHERLRQWCQTNDFTMAVVLRGLVARFLDEYGAPAGRPSGRTGATTVAPADHPRKADQPRK